jgi:mannose-1-phosphate guanylyltransferase
VARFVEKPDQAAALELQAQGGVWNSFLLAARGWALLELYQSRLPGLLERFQEAFAQAPGGPEASEARGARLAALYAELPSHDFSRELLQGSEERLRLEVVPPCGWTDLGTPARVEACLAALREETELRSAVLFPEARSEFDLARALRAMRATLSEGAAALPA